MREDIERFFFMLIGGAVGALIISVIISLVKLWL
jgi:hypothetical protein